MDEIVILVHMHNNAPSPNRGKMNWTNLGSDEPEARKRDFLITSIRIENAHGHDRLTIWNRGACSGTLVLNSGDGMKLAELLTAGNDLWSCTP